MLIICQYSVIQDKQDKCNKLISKIDVEWAQKEEPEIIKKFESNFKNEYKKHRQTVQISSSPNNNISNNDTSEDKNDSTETHNSINIKDTEGNENKLNKMDILLNEQNNAKSDIPSTSFSFSFNASEVCRVYI